MEGLARENTSCDMSFFHGDASGLWSAHAVRVIAVVLRVCVTVCVCATLTGFEATALF